MNDTYGHEIGDLVLQGLVSLLQNNLRVTDLLAWFGGEGFVRNYHIPFSAGVAEWNPGITAEHWLRLTDDAMYKSKKNGRNRVTLASGVFDKTIFCCRAGTLRVKRLLGLLSPIR